MLSYLLGFSFQEFHSFNEAFLVYSCPLFMHRSKHAWRSCREVH